MHFLREILLFLAYICAVTEQRSIQAGYVPGVSGIPLVDESTCITGEALTDPYLSLSPECARTCHVGEQPRTCYYKFVVERYAANTQACTLCTSNFTNNICPNCQCVPTNGIERSILTVNRMLPGPTIQVCKDDYIVVDVQNEIDGDSITIHWHGVFQQDFQYYDGVPFVTQCPIPSGTTFRYKYRASNSGTHFWHAHTGLQKMDGITGTLVIRDPPEVEPNAYLYDFDLVNHVIHLSDWMNEGSVERFPGRNTGVTRQLPDSVLINGKGQYQNSTSIVGSFEVITVEPNRRYRFRTINSFCSICSGLLTVEGHNLTVIATDGIAIQPVVVDSILSFAGERYDFVINTDKPFGSYWIQLRGSNDCAGNQIHSLAILNYLGSSTTPATPQPRYNPGLNPGVILNPTDVDCNNAPAGRVCVNDLRSAVAVDPAILQQQPDVKLILPVTALVSPPQNLFRPNTYNKFIVPIPSVHASAKIDGISFQSLTSPPVSQLYDIPADEFCNGSNRPARCVDKNSTCACSHTIPIPLNALVEVVLIDQFNVPNINHPFHLHGYAFSVIAMGQPVGPVGNVTLSVDMFKQLDATNQIRRNFKLPPRKDTLAVPNNGFVIFRFHATNPGYWFFHCHFIYHQLAGMALIYKVGRQSDLPPVPQGFPKCGQFQPPIWSY